MHSSGEYYSILTVCETKKTWKCDFNLESNPSEPQPLLNDFIIYNLLVSPNGFKDQVQASEMENFSVLKMKEILTCAVTRVDLEDIMLIS